MGNIKIPLLDTLRITKSLVRKIYLSGAWEPPLPTRLQYPHPFSVGFQEVIDDIVSAIDCKNSCAGLFIDLSKAFDTVDHSILLKCLGKIGVSTNAIGRFKNYLTTRFQFVTYDGITSGKAEIHKTPF